MAFSNCIPKTKKCFSNVFIDKIRGGFASKLDELQVLLSDNNVDIAVITETWLNDDIDTNILQIPGYMLFRGSGRITVGPEWAAGPPERPGGPRETSVLRGFKRACKRPPEIAR